jgi:hypothetical protein
VEGVRGVQGEQGEQGVQGVQGVPGGGVREVADGCVWWLAGVVGRRRACAYTAMSPLAKQCIAALSDMNDSHPLAKSTFPAAM